MSLLKMVDFCIAFLSVYLMVFCYRWCFHLWLMMPGVSAAEGRKVGSLKRRVQSQLARGETKNGTPLWREAHFEVKSVKIWQLWSSFRSWDDEKLHSVVERSTFSSKNAHITAGPGHFWKLRCRRSARRCGAKHISYTLQLIFQFSSSYSFRNRSFRNFENQEEINWEVSA